MNKRGIRSFSGQPSQRQLPKEQRLEIKAGHNGERVVVVFTRPIENMMLTEQEAESHIASLQGSLAALRKHKEENP